MGIVRPVMEVYPHAWGFFVPFILIATFTMLNLFIAVVVNAMQSYHDMEAEHAEASHSEHAELLAEVRALRSELQALMQSYHDMEAEHAEASHSEHAELLAEVRALRSELQALKAEREGG